MDYLSSLSPALRLLAVFGGAIALGVLLHAVLFWLLARTGDAWSRFEWMTRRRIRLLRGPTRLLVPIVLVYAAAPLWTESVSAETADIVYKLLFVASVVGLAWLGVKVVDFVNSIAVEKYTLDIDDNLHNRKVLTNVQLARRLADVVIVIVAISTILLSFERFQELGAGLLASAGIAGIVLGVAAQKTLGTLFAGFQIAWTQPIRVDDVVIVEGEWGRIEEITLTYAVVRIWDQRRLVVPINHFIENPVENWTRTSSDLLGTVYLRCDYTVEFDAVREELRRVCEASEFWDERVCKIQVTGVDEKTVELRCLVSAADASAAFELRCQVREALIAFLQDQQPAALPVHRARLERIPAEQVRSIASDAS